MRSLEIAEHTHTQGLVRPLGMSSTNKSLKPPSKGNVLVGQFPAKCKRKRSIVKRSRECASVMQTLVSFLRTGLSISRPLEESLNSLGKRLFLLEAWFVRIMRGDPTLS